MTPKDFKSWRSRLGLTQARAAELLGVKTDSIKQYESGRRAISKSIEKLCAYMETAAKP